MTGKRLLILSCSQRKKTPTPAYAGMQAVDLYDGPAYRTLHAQARKGFKPQGLAILSAQYGVLLPQTTIGTYDRRMTSSRADFYCDPIQVSFARHAFDNIREAAGLGKSEAWDEVFFFGGATYRQVVLVYALEGFFAPRNITYARGGIGSQLGQLKAFLERCTPAGQAPNKENS